MAGLSAENKLRDVYNPRVITALADRINETWPSFNHGGFVNAILSELDDFGLGERTTLIRDALVRYLPQEFPQAADILVRSLGPELKGTKVPFKAFIVMPQCAYVSEYGRQHFEVSMNALHEMTRRFTAEGYLRTFIEVDYERAMDVLHTWIADSSPHVRRLVSEGTRPRLPMAGRIKRFQQDPKPVISLLERLKNDNSEYVRRSVANNMNDIAKDNPELALSTLTRWSHEARPELMWVVRHAARTLVKQGHPEVFSILGYTQTPEVDVSHLDVLPLSIKRGGTIRLSFTVSSLSSEIQKLVIDYAVHFQKANGSLAPKVFKFRNLNLSAEGTVSYEKPLTLNDTSGRTIYPGPHEIEVLVKRIRQSSFYRLLNYRGRKATITALLLSKFPITQDTCFDNSPNPLKIYRRLLSASPVLELASLMESDELKYWVAFNRIPGIGRVRFKLLESHFGSLKEAWEANAGSLKAAGLDGRTIGSITSRRPKVDPDAEFSRVVDSGTQALTWHDEAYPTRLKEIYDVPPVLYVRGSLLTEDERSVAVVGTRRPTAYGRQVAGRLTYDIASASVTVVSGLARGIDAIAHKAALDAGGRTIAVMGSGIDVIYPREHDQLADQIVENGALVTEHPMGTRPDSRNFPRRNRILSGMTLGTVVIEAGESSGALITARHSLDENREVFAVPGNIFSPGSFGANRLIRDGSAKLVTDYADILQELNLTSVGNQIEMVALFPEDETEAEVLRYVSYDPIHIDEVIRESDLGISTVSSALAMMELKGIVKQVGGMNYIRIREAPAEYQTVV